MTSHLGWRRYARLFGPDPAADVKDELRFHLEAKIDDLVSQGWPPEAARQEAERQLGNLRALQQIGASIGEKMERRKRLQDYWSDSLQGALKDSGAGAGLGRKHERVRAVLVVSEVGLACVLLVSAGLLLRSFLKVLDVDLGFQPDRAASIKVDYDERGNSFDPGKRAAAFQQILARVTALPGVEAAGIADYLPLGPNRQWDEPVPQGKTFAPGELPAPLVYVVTPGFIRAMGIGLPRPRLHLGRWAA